MVNVSTTSSINHTVQQKKRLGLTQIIDLSPCSICTLYDADISLATSRAIIPFRNNSVSRVRLMLVPDVQDHRSRRKKIKSRLERGTERKPLGCFRISIGTVINTRPGTLVKTFESYCARRSLSPFRRYLDFVRDVRKVVSFDLIASL